MYSPQIAASLRDAGYDVASVKERPELVSHTDVQLLSVMADERRALLSENVVDFAPLIRQLAADGGSHYGMIYSSPNSMPRSRHTIGVFIRALTATLEQHPGDDDFVNRTEWLSPPDR
jgi:hypothetical protein